MHYEIKVGGNIAITLRDGDVLHGKVLKVVLIGLFVERNHNKLFVPFSTVKSMEMIS